jgi:hypothetical protein
MVILKKNYAEIRRGVAEIRGEKEKDFTAKAQSSRRKTAEFFAPFAVRK